ncbi:MAG: hypothetical protein JWO85_3613 [Candidatus Eremiobacteraeota bacterium]|nr:hypothetical protein [Candidatus Eremiobacteraeota bacterium]
MEIDVLVGSIGGPLGDDVQVLSRAERATVTRLRCERDRRAHIAGRSIVRRRLALETASLPADVPLEIDSRGRPTSAAGPRFSIAHAGELVAVAFAPCAVGVDVEPLVAIEDVDLLIGLYASGSERTVLRSLPRPRRDWAFLNAWVRKEAILKAAGTGITGDLTQVDTQFDVVEIQARRWRVVTLPHLCAGYVAAVAVANAVESSLNVAVLPAPFAKLPEAAS